MRDALKGYVRPSRQDVNGERAVDYGLGRRFQVQLSAPPLRSDRTYGDASTTRIDVRAAGFGGLDRNEKRLRLTLARE